MPSTEKLIICGTDFSTHAEEAANAAAAIAKRIGARVLLIHVIEPTLGPNEPTVLGLLHERSRGQLTQAAERLRSRGLQVEEELLTGAPYMALAEAARSRSASMVVVSTLGRIAPSRFLVGSVAERTVQSSPVPTLIVRGSEPLESWAAGKRALNVFVAYDFSATADAALGWAGGLRQIGPCNITVAYAAYPPEESRRLGSREHQWLAEVPAELRAVVERDLGKRAAHILGSETAKIRVVEALGRPDPHLLNLAKEAHADLIVAGTHRRGPLNRLWLGSVSRALLHHAAVSVAIVPPTATAEGSAVKVPAVKRILAPTDFSELANRAVGQAYAALARGGTIRLIHVRPPGAGKQPPADAEIKAKLQSLVPAEAESKGIETEFEVANDENAGTAISQAAERFGADWICIGSHGRSGMSKALFGSVAQEVLAQTKIPVLVVRPPEP